MAKYSSFLYSTAKYGEAALLAYSVEPMSIVVLDYKKVQVSWQNPKGNFTKIRVVRNQIGFPETEEDGIYVYEEAATQGNVSVLSLIDGKDNLLSTPISSGRPIYYAVFLFTSDKVWRKAGQIADVVPLDHGTQKSFIDILPRVYTSDIHSQLGVVDETSDLYKFVSGLTFTVDQLKTQIDLLRPLNAIDITSHLLLINRDLSYGLFPESNMSTKNQKIMARETLYMYSHKGVKTGIETYVESLTGYGPTITTSANLLLSAQDSTFCDRNNNGSIGNWQTTNVTLTASTDVVPATGANVIDTVFTGKVVASSSASISLGADDPIRKGVPVQPSTEYIFLSKVTKSSGTGNVVLYIDWYDKNASLISTDNSSTVSANGTWKSVTATKTSPSAASYAVLRFTFASGTYYIDQIAVQPSSYTDYDEARAIDIFLNPNKTNYIKNPSFEVNVTDSWTLAGSATAAQDTDVSSEVYSGSNSAKITATGNWTFTSNAMPVELGQYYVGSGFLKTNANISVSYVALDSSLNVLQTSSPVSLGTISSWARFESVDLIDFSNLNIAYYQLRLSGGAGNFYLDDMQFEKAIRLTEYFDGSVPSDFGAVWEGTANNSYTRLYVGKSFKVPRLAQTLNDWLPPNSFWRLRSYAGVEATNLTV